MMPTINKTVKVVGLSIPFKWLHKPGSIFDPFSVAKFKDTTQPIFLQENVYKNTTLHLSAVIDKKYCNSINN